MIFSLIIIPHFLFKVNSVQIGERIIIVVTHLHIKLNVFRAKFCCPYYNSLLKCVQIGTTVFNEKFTKITAEIPKTDDLGGVYLYVFY